MFERGWLFQFPKLLQGWVRLHMSHDTGHVMNYDLDVRGWVQVRGRAGNHPAKLGIDCDWGLRVIRILTFLRQSDVI
jgi:hypothetical protein